MSSRLFVFTALFSVTVLPVCPQQQRTHDFLGLGTPPDEAAAKIGEPLYKQNCAACHGENARGGEGPNLVRSTLVLHDEKGRDIAPVVKNGRPESGMPAFPNLKSEEIYDIAEYLHLQIERAANRGMYDSIYAGQRSQIKGDPAKGKTFFDGHCSKCHSASGDLSKIALKYPEGASLQSRFIWPHSRAPVTGTVKTSSGETITGTILKVDDFDLSLRDTNGQTHEWPRDQVQVKLEDKLAGHRALLPVYTDSDLHNLTAYLVTLK